MHPGPILKPTIVLHSTALQEPSAPPFSRSVRLALALIRGYQLTIRPLLHGSCRFVPTCSHYAADAIAAHGVVKGAWLAVRRLVRCHPFGGAGLDPVP